MLLDIAAGVENPVDIAFRYGFSASEFARLSESQEFLRELKQQRAENDRNGVTARNTAGMFFDILSQKYFQRLLADDVAIGALAAGVETFAVLGGRKPKASVAEVSGAAFQIVFNIPQAGIDLKNQMRTVNAETVEAKNVFDSITFNNEEPDDE